MYACVPCQLSNQSAVYDEVEDLEFHIVIDHDYTPCFRCIDCIGEAAIFWTQSTLVKHHIAKHKRKDNFPIKCIFNPKRMKDRRKVWECINESTIPRIKFEGTEYVDYALPKSLDQCEKCVSILNEPNKPCSTIMGNLEIHLYGKQQYNNSIYVCSACTTDIRLPTEHSLLTHYTNDHRKLNDISIEYILNEDISVMQKRIRQCLIDARRFLELKKYNTAQLPISFSPNSNSGSDNQDEIIWMENESSNQNIKVEQNVCAAKAHTIESNSLANDFAAKIESMSSAASAVTGSPLGYNSSTGAPSLASNWSMPNNAELPVVLLPQASFASSQMLERNAIDSENPYLALIKPVRNNEKTCITEVPPQTFDAPTCPMSVSNNTTQGSVLLEMQDTVMPNLYSHNSVTSAKAVLFNSLRATSQPITSAPTNGFPVSCETQNLDEVNGTEVSASLKMKFKKKKHDMYSVQQSASMNEDLNERSLIRAIGMHNDAETGNISNRSIGNASTNIYDFEPEDELGRWRQSTEQPNGPPVKYYFSEACKLKRLKNRVKDAYFLFRNLHKPELEKDLKQHNRDTGSNMIYSRFTEETYDKLPEEQRNLYKEEWNRRYNK